MDSTSADFSNTLVIGGTGMLAAATRHLSERTAALTVVARHPRRLDGLAAEYVERMAVDYHQTNALVDRLEQAVGQYGEFDLAVTWVHSSATDSLCRVAEWLDAQARRVRLVDVRGSAVARPDATSGRHEFLCGLDGLCYQRVVLGFVRTGGSSRWLTDDEISTGVIQAVESGAKEHIVGVVEPWDDRP